MEYMGDTVEDAYALLYEWKELPRHDWKEYMFLPVHLYEIHPLTFYKQEKRNFP